MTASTAQPSDTDYRVLARKYRPDTFDKLIGQQAMVRTLTNAIGSGRLAHAFILSGVRGTGKTTTARLIARALNCIGEDGKGEPTISPCGVCEHCVAIGEDRHMDVLEMDAASRTGVNDIREIIESVAYRPTSARYKVYIIDEVHMLSKSAFNALLKTLEEPPQHVKFVFATTEIRRLPVTVLSRCQRFDLRRVDQRTLSQHFAKIAQQEGAKIADAALALIARAADGSVRDGLSLLDQAIAHCGDHIDEARMRHMLGLADRARTFDLLEMLIKGQIKEALELLGEHYQAGEDLTQLFTDMLELVHWLTRLKVVGEKVESDALSPETQTRGVELAGKLTMASLARLWQMLLKGLDEIRLAPMPLQAAEMVLIRLAYVADLPSPEETVRRLAKKDGETQPQGDNQSPPTKDRAPQPATSAQISPTPQQQEGATQRPSIPQSFTELVELAADQREAVLRAELINNVHLVSFAVGRLEISLDAYAPADLPSRLTKFLNETTGRDWQVVLSTKEGAPTLHQQSEAEELRLQDEIVSDPLVKKVLEVFPGSEITKISKAASSG